MSPPIPATDSLRLKLNQETARMHWHELQKFFAAGLVVLVDDTLDLIEVAVSFTADDKTAVATWMAGQKIAKASDVQAAQWLAEDAVLWAVVVRPWILVQRQKPAAPATMH